MKKINDIEDIARWRLCTGCGACVPACPEHAVRLVDIEDQGFRPVINSDNCKECGTCVKVCPGIGMSHEPFNNQTISELRQAWGPVLEVWEGYAVDPEIRFKGSSGGIATALALYCLYEMDVGGVLNIGADPENPLANIPVLNCNRDQLMAQTGSRYSPAAPCVGFGAIEASNSNSVFVGKPCDVAALRKAQLLNATLASKVSLSISIFCAGTPSSRGTKALLDKFNVKPQDVAELRYRGCGWPGKATVKLKGTEGQHCQMSYEQSWGEILSRHVPLRCRLCPDGTGEFADISCGDPWYKPTEPTGPGQSLVLIRTEKGRKVIREAIESGYVKLRPVGSFTVAASQTSLLNKRRHLWGRLLAMRIACIPIPYYKGFSLFTNWYHLSLFDKIRSIFGTFRRITLRKTYRPIDSFSVDLDTKNLVPIVSVNTRVEDG